jgi:hypothetical protein
MIILIELSTLKKLSNVCYYLLTSIGIELTYTVMLIFIYLLGNRGSR